MMTRQEEATKNIIKIAEENERLKKNIETILTEQKAQGVIINWFYDEVTGLYYWE